MLKARQTLRVAGIAVILNYTRIYKRATTVLKLIFVVSDVRFNDVMRIPRGQPHATSFTRPFLAFCVRRGWLARLVQLGAERGFPCTVCVPIVIIFSVAA